MPFRQKRRGGMILSAVITVMSLTTAVFADTAQIELSGTREYKAVRLTPPVYNTAARDLSDLLVLDGDGNPVPYFIHNVDTVRVDEEGAAYPLTLDNAFVKDGDTYDDLKAEADDGRDLLATAIEVDTRSALFAKTVELSGSYDGLVWDAIQTDRLYRVDGSEKVQIAFAQPLKYTHYRFKTRGNTRTEFAIDSATLLYNRHTVEQAYFTQDYTPEFAAETADGTTVIKLVGLKNVRINELTIAVAADSRFKREVRYANGRVKELYNLAFGGAVYQDMILPFDGYAGSGDTIEVRIANGDDAPIGIEGVSLSYFVDEVVFQGGGAAYTLAFGDEAARAPQYDIVNYRELILNEGYDQLTLGAITREAPPPEPADYSAVFNGVVIACACLLGGVILLRLRKG